MSDEFRNDQDVQRHDDRPRDATLEELVTLLKNQRIPVTDEGTLALPGGRGTVQIQEKEGGIFLIEYRAPERFSPAQDHPDWFDFFPGLSHATVVVETLVSYAEWENRHEQHPGLGRPPLPLQSRMTAIGFPVYYLSGRAAPAPYGEASVLSQVAETSGVERTARQKRDAAILAAVADGCSYAKVAAAAGLSKGRIFQIVRDAR